MLGQVLPRGIVGFNEPDFLFAAPRFDFFFTSNGRVYIVEALEVNQAEDTVARGKAGDQPLSMLERAALEITCYASVETAGATGEDVDAVDAIHGGLESSGRVEKSKAETKRKAGPSHGR